MAWQRWMVASVLAGGIVCAGAAAVAAEAPAEPGHARRGFYGGVGFIFAPSAFDLDDAERLLPASNLAGNALHVDNTWGLDARVGYRLCPRLAIEGDYQYLPGFDVERGGDGTLTTVDTNAFTLNGKFYAMTDALQPYVVGGVGLLAADTDDALPGFSGDGVGFAGRLGGGVDYFVRPEVVINVEFSVVLGTGGVADVRTLPLVVGAQYRF